jgi:AraC-like DNA-binding protein
MSKHCSHELIEVRQTPTGMIIGEGWTIRFEQEIHHYIQQYVTSLVYSIFRLTGADEAFFKHVSMVPHPKYGLAHLAPWLHVQPAASVDGYLRIEVESQWANRAFAKPPELSGSVHVDSNADVIDPALENTARTVLKLHMMAGKPSVDRLVRVAGCSRRTLQRALAERRATFQSLLEDVRQEVGTAELLQGKLSRADIAVRLGYSRQSTLSHAIRRWKGRRSIS